MPVKVAVPISVPSLVPTIWCCNDEWVQQPAGWECIFGVSSALDELTDVAGLLDHRRGGGGGKGAERAAQGALHDRVVEVGERGQRCDSCCVGGRERGLGRGAHSACRHRRGSAHGVGESLASMRHVGVLAGRQLPPSVGERLAAAPWP